MQFMKALWRVPGAKEIQTDKYIVVVYKEVSEKDGFVITAFLSSRKKQLERRTKVWQRQK
jgi:hypothetical protein